MDNQKLANQKLKYAGLKVRFIAHIIDITILAIVMFSIVKLLKFISYDEFIVLEEIIGLILAGFYYVFFTASSKYGTIGKQFMGIKVVDEKMQGLSISHSLGRYLAYYFSYLTLGVGFLMIYFTKKHNGLHDKIANTYVIYGRS